MPDSPPTLVLGNIGMTETQDISRDQQQQAEWDAPGFINYVWVGMLVVLFCYFVHELFCSKRHRP